MRYRIAYLFIIIFCNSFQLYSQDTIQLNEVSVEKNAKKAKVKKIKYGKDGHNMSHELYFTEYPVFYLTDSLPMGQIQEVTLFFSQLARKMKAGFRDFKIFKGNKTEFEVTLYEVNDDYSIGNKVNDRPIPIVFGETDSSRLQKVKLDLSQYNFKANRFFICMEKITDTGCEECYYFGPILYKTGKKYHYITDGKNDIYKEQKNDHGCFGLKMDVKTLTSEY